MIGHVKYFDGKHGFGFIMNYHDDSEIFVGRHSIKANDRYKVLAEGQPVSYDVGLDNKGNTVAVNVRAMSINDVIVEFTEI